MGSTRIVGSGLRLWAESWFPWLLVTLVLTGTVAVSTAVVDPWSATYGVEWWFGDPPVARPDPNGLAVLLGLVGTFLLGPWEFVILTRAALRSTFAEPLRGSALIGGTIRGVHSVLWIFVLLALLAIPLFLAIFGIVYAARDTEATALLLLIPLALSLYFVPRLATLANVFVGLDARGTKAIGGAWRLSSGAWATSAGAIVLAVLLALAMSIPVGALMTELFPAVTRSDAIARAVIQSFLNGLLTPMTTAIVAVLYVELMARKGLLDQEALRRNLARFDR
ncbi:MAG TPA: hypothetical protein VFZ75_07815 [Actinomycetota bacterium]|nr:hypothetical protein [Actinomycetota bacterium]